MNILQFPTSYDDYMRLGLQAYEEENYQLAIEHLTQAYKIKPTQDVHELIVRSYTCLGEYQEAKNLVIEELPKYLREDSGVELYFDLLCETNEWITAHKLVISYDILKPKIEQLKFLEKAYQMYQKNQVEGLKEDLLKSKNNSPLYQMTLWKKAKFLPLYDYLSVVKRSLVEVDLCLLVRAHLLESLHSLQIKEKVNYLDINQKILSVKLSILPTMESDDNYQIFIHETQKLIEKEPQLLQHINKLLPFVFYCLLPTPDKYLKNPKKFARIFLSRFGFDKKFYLNMTDEEKDIIDKIQNQIVKLG